MKKSNQSCQIIYFWVSWTLYLVQGWEPVKHSGPHLLLIVKCRLKRHNVSHNMIKKRRFKLPVVL